MERRQSVLASIHRGDWDGNPRYARCIQYLHIPIHPVSRKYLRFVFRDKVYPVSGPLLWPFDSSLEFLLLLVGISVGLYLDDWLLRSPSKDKCMEDMHKTIHLTQELGLLLNLQKSQLTPSQEILYLGIILNSQVFWAFASHKRISNCLQTVRKFLALSSCLTQQWMSLLGTLASIETFVKLGRLHMRVLQFYLKANWNRKTQLDSLVFPITPR